MLTASELKAYAHMRRLKLIDHAWKDYLQDLLLYLLYRKEPRFVFKGGTALWKVMKGDRFSEDIDLCIDRLPDKLDDYLQNELRLYGFGCRVLKKKQTQNVMFLKLGLTSPAHPREITLSIEILISKKCADTTDTVTMYSPYPDVPPVEMLVPSREEIASDKISAIFHRNKPRDIHDLYLLLKQGTGIDKKRVEQKVPGFTYQKLKEKLLEKRTSWETLEPLVSTKLPPIDEEVRYILSFFRTKV